MLFLLKCMIFLGIVLLAIAAREGGERDAHVAGRSPARGGGASEAAASLGAARAAISDIAGRAADQAAGRVAEAARDHCLAHPLDCLRAAEKLQAAKIEPGKR
ncbi:hypothetical protein [Methylosinus sp. Sm6]|uniref:hypothetical protein n=1 Tax=Methylosinus sp. Sm6 TaxID=2866948 RepID=UPI001C9A1DEE|nr:hypothetical protein [Methylosinus sp. Sm6]MBY6241607.1 hypothetical protein [Methylosinus sp. Sm6]